MVRKKAAEVFKAEILQVINYLQNPDGSTTVIFTRPGDARGHSFKVKRLEDLYTEKEKIEDDEGWDE